MSNGRKKSSGKDWYKQQLATDEWKKCRQEVYRRDQRLCVDCGEKGVRINCHHSYYVKGKKPWDYPIDAFVTVCDQCHETRHRSLIQIFASEEDAEVWFIFEEVEMQFYIDEQLKRAERIEQLEALGAVWDRDSRFYGLTDSNGNSRFFNEDGNLL